MLHRLRSRTIPHVVAAGGVAVSALLGAGAVPGHGQPHHDRAFWQGIVDTTFAVPADASVADLARELSDMLASPDPERRDAFGYTILTAWIYQRRVLDADAVRPLMKTWLERLRRPAPGETDAIFGRSFSALMLGVLAARDNAEAFLTQAEVRELLDAGLAYLAAEHDVRGYDPRKGWMHATAHTADLLKFAARSRWVTPRDQERVLTAIADKLRTAPSVFVFGEDERLARAVLSIVKRSDFDLAGFRAWAARHTPAFPDGALPDPQALAGFQNMKNLFAKLAVLLALDDQLHADGQAARDAVRTALAKAY